MSMVDGGDAYSNYAGLKYCYPDTAVWDKPAEPTLSDPPTDEEQAAHDKWEYQVDIAEAFAWRALQTLTAGRIAVCEVTVRPCKKSCRQGSYYFPQMPFTPVLTNGMWINVWCSHRGNDCSCTAVEEVVLPGPVARVDSVVVDGEVLDADTYYVRDGNRLVRVDGGKWPLCQDMNKLSGEGTFFVTYLQGVEPDQLVNHAAGVLAGELVKKINGDKHCRLPKGTTQVTRQGVTYEIVNDIFGNGVTGIDEVDIVIRSINPHGLRTPPRVWSPDMQQISRPTAGRWSRG